MLNLAFLKSSSNFPTKELDYTIVGLITESK